MFYKGFDVCAGGRHFRAKENSVLFDTLSSSMVFDLCSQGCEIIGCEKTTEGEREENTGMFFVIRRNFGKLQIVSIESDIDTLESEDELFGMALSVCVADAEEVEAGKVDG